MADGDDESLRRVKFFSPGDLATGLYVGRVVEVVEAFDPAVGLVCVMDVLELYNVLKYLEQGLFPVDYGEDQRATALAKQASIRAAIGRFVSTISADTLPTCLAGLEHWHHDDLLELLGRHGVYQRLGANTVLPALDEVQMHLSDLLGCRKLVAEYGDEIRDRLLASPSNAEFVVRKFLASGDRIELHLPPSFTAADSRGLLESYVDSAGANPNYLRLIEFAPTSAGTRPGIDAKLKLRAKRRYAEWSKEFFAEGSSTSILRAGFEIILSSGQVEPVVFIQEDTESDGLVSRFTYSREWFDQTRDNPSIMNNFQHLFEFANWQVILALPSYTADLGVSDRYIKVTGKSDYVTGAGFDAVNTSTLLQTQLYQRYLESQDRSLESVIEWFFCDYLAEEFGAEDFLFEPSDAGSSFVQRIRHLFSEMESVITQFSLYVDNGELDRELLEMTADQVRYLDIPSLLTGKYVYATEHEEVLGVLFTLFSDQAGMGYLREDLRADDLLSLIRENDVAYDDFAEFQRDRIDRLLELGILRIVGGVVRMGESGQMVVLRSLWATEAASYYHLSEPAKAYADAMVERGWASRRSTLLTDAEGKYFNYFLNNVEFSNGLRLRNRYAHGAQPAGDETAHYNTYVTVLRLMVALVIKINDEFCVAAAMESSGDEK